MLKQVKRRLAGRPLLPWHYRDFCALVALRRLLYRRQSDGASDRSQPLYRGLYSPPDVPVALQDASAGIARAGQGFARYPCPHHHAAHRATREAPLRRRLGRMGIWRAAPASCFELSGVRRPLRCGFVTQRSAFPRGLPTAWLRALGLDGGLLWALRRIALVAARWPLDPKDCPGGCSFPHSCFGAKTRWAADGRHAPRGPPYRPCRRPGCGRRRDDRRGKPGRSGAHLWRTEIVSC